MENTEQKLKNIMCRLFTEVSFPKHLKERYEKDLKLYDIKIYHDPIFIGDPIPDELFQVHTPVFFREKKKVEFYQLLSEMDYTKLWDMVIEEECLYVIISDIIYIFNEDIKGNLWLLPRSDEYWSEKCWKLQKDLV